MLLNLVVIIMKTYTAWKVSNYGVFSGPCFHAFGLNTERYSVSPCIQSECGKIWTRKNSVFGHFSHSDSVLEEWLTYILSGFRRQDGLVWKRRVLDLFNTFHATVLGNFSPLLKIIFGGDIKNYFLKYWRNKRRVFLRWILSCW